MAPFAEDVVVAGIIHQLAAVAVKFRVALLSIFGVFKAQVPFLYDAGGG